MLERLFTAKSFDPEHVLVSKFDGDKPLCTPDATQRDQLLAWVEGIKSQQLPAWLGLPNNAEKVLLTLRGEGMLRNLLKVSDDELAFTGDGEKEAKPQWMAQIGELAQQWLKLLPKDINRMRRTVDNIKDPLFRFFEREINLGAQLLRDIRHDLEEILSVCRAERKQSNETRALASALQKGVVPVDWLRYTVPKDVTVMDWVLDFSERVKQLARIGASDNLKREEVWLGGTFSPEAYVTATRQQVAQANTWSLEQLHLHVTIGRTDRLDVDSGGKTVVSTLHECALAGMELRGAESSGGNALRLSDEVKTSCDCVEFSWKQESPEGVRLPLYLYGDRRQLVTSLAFAVSPATAFYERGVALVANAALS
ncbi:unnamed protein product [Strongylus vulgaris]|uniref:Dynein heavy chain C-terminal domain-containing protein n=1 Tax=Strongylus vulgaris TaxID=40348 RepID=A0A3P7IDP8_STRVU|nr:unnamed protein product [Strongylus vulgaris]